MLMIALVTSSNIKLNEQAQPMLQAEKLSTSKFTHYMAAQSEITSLRDLAGKVQQVI